MHKNAKRQRHWFHKKATQLNSRAGFILTTCATLAIGFAGSSISLRAAACTMFASPFGDGRISHNFDLQPQNLMGGLVANPSSLKKTGLILGASIPPAVWVSKWRSLTFSVTGAEFPVGGFNEKGLFVGILVLDSAQFPPVSDPRPALSGAQFVQYNLDVSATIDDVIASDKVLRPFSPLFKTHFFTCDSSGACAVLQYVGGKLIIYRGSTLPYSTLTNSLYPDSVLAAQQCAGASCQFNDNSLWRFAETVQLKGKMQNDGTYDSQAFAILDQVAQTVGPLTRFQVLYDPKASRIEAKAKGGSLSFLNFNFSSLIGCTQSRQFIAIQSSTQGDLSNSWQPLTEAIQTQFAIDMGLPPSAAAAYGQFPFQSVSCQSVALHGADRERYRSPAQSQIQGRVAARGRKPIVD